MNTHGINTLKWPGMIEWFEILLLWVIFYFLLRLLRGTRGAQVLSGLVLSLVLVLALTSLLNLQTLNWLFSKFSVNLVLAFVIIFQPEIRRALAELGRPNVLVSGGAAGSLDFVTPLVKATTTLSAQKIGALIAIERDVGLRAAEESGVAVDSLVNAEILTSLFFPRSPLHDGGVVIRGNRVVAAGCMFPLSQREELHRSLGTRHRAAIGITEETDAVVVVVSEETGTISIAFKGRLSRGLDGDRLQRMLGSLLSPNRRRSAPGSILDQTGTATDHGRSA